MADTIHIIACSVFKDAIASLADEIADRPFSFIYLPSNLHLRPNVLRTKLLACIRRTKENHPRVGCLYGRCFEDIDRCIEPQGVIRIPCSHCYEILLGHRRHKEITDSQPGTFFVEKELLLDFDELCRRPLELDDPEMRDLYFKHYRQIVYIRQPRDPDLTAQLSAVADILKLKLHIEDADYTELKSFFDRLG